jgi:hypothetical protein
MPCITPLHIPKSKKNPALEIKIVLLVTLRLAKFVPDAGWYPPSVFFQGMKSKLFKAPALPIGSRYGRLTA